MRWLVPLLFGLLLLPLGARAQDTDLDGFPDPVDNCVVTPNEQADADEDGRGDACECGDSRPDGHLTRRDVRESNRCRRGRGGEDCAALCDTTGDGLCLREDVRRLRLHIRGKLTKDDLICARRPKPDCDAWLTLPGCPDYGNVVEHVLGRVGNSADDWTRRQVFERGLAQHVIWQLFPEAENEVEFAAALEPYVSGPFAIWDKSIPTLESQFCNQGSPACTDFLSNPSHPNASLAEVKMLRAIYSRRQLESVLLDFWLNHFNVDAGHRIALWAEQQYEQKAIRPHMLGKFEDLLLSVTKGIAMLDYLDLRRNTRFNSNENYPRELMELGTLGLEDTYDEQDVQEVARVLTGWTFNSAREFVYVAGNHDPDPKTVTIENTVAWEFDGTLGCGGREADEFENEGHVLLCLLARHPKTAERLTRKLAKRFVAENPPDELVKRGTKVWLATGGDLRAVYATLLLSKELFSLKYAGEKVKRPSVYTASVLRAAGADLGLEGTSQIAFQQHNSYREVTSFNGIMGDLDLMGERLFRAPPPTGYPEASPAWASAGGLLVRMNLAERLIAQIEDAAAYWRIPDDANSKEIVWLLQAELAPGKLSDTTLKAAVRFLESGPLFKADLDTRVRQTARLILSSPEFMAH